MVDGCEYHFQLINNELSELLRTCVPAWRNVEGSKGVKARGFCPVSLERIEQVDISCPCRDTGPAGGQHEVSFALEDHAHDEPSGRREIVNMQRKRSGREVELDIREWPSAPRLDPLEKMRRQEFGEQLIWRTSDTGPVNVADWHCPRCDLDVASFVCVTGGQGGTAHQRYFLVPVGSVTVRLRTSSLPRRTLHSYEALEDLPEALLATKMREMRTKPALL